MWWFSFNVRVPSTLKWQYFEGGLFEPKNSLLLQVIIYEDKERKQKARVKQFIMRTLDNAKCGIYLYNLDTWVKIDAV